MFRRLRVGLLLILAACLVFIGTQFLPSASIAAPPGYAGRLAVWMEIDYVMLPANAAKRQEMADTLKYNGVTDGYFYVSYLKPGDFFNPTYDHAAEFTRWMHEHAPEIRLLAWIGVPISVTQPDGTAIANRLEDAAIRQQISDFAVSMVTEYGFDGVHLNAELISNDDMAFIETLKTVRAALPEGAFFSVAAHALRLEIPVTFTPYPDIEFHWTTDFLRRAADHADQIALMAYDSGLPTPADYRAWTAYQAKLAAAALKDHPAELLIGISASEEWTGSHQVQAEYLANGLSGVLRGLNESPVPADGIAIYAGWEISTDEWRAIAQTLPE